MYFQQIKSRILPALLLTLLASCSTKQAPTPPIDTTTVTEIEEIVIDPTTLSAEQHLALAQTLTTDEAVYELITASKLFYQQQNYLKALWLADKTLPLIDESTTNAIHEQVQLTLIKTSSLQQLGRYAQSHIQLNQLEQYAKNNEITLSTTYYQLLSIALQEKQQDIAALNAQLYAYETAGENARNQQQVDALWLKFQHLSQWQLNLLALDQAPASEGWLKLTALANKFGSNQAQMQYHLNIWQKKFKQHPATTIAQQLMAQETTPLLIDNIAVLIPLTGNQRSAGLAIQQGVLASFANDATKKLHFIDSNTVNWYGLSNDLIALEVDYVIGPLLKSNVDKYIKHTSAQANNQSDYMLNANADIFDVNSNQDPLDNSTDKRQTPINYLTAVDSDSAIQSYLQPTSNPKAVTTLLLNMPAKASLTEQHTVFSMRPEDEASQAAATLSRKQYQNPIVLSQKNIISKRIAQAFVKEWQILTGKSIEVVYYDTGPQMQANIKASLSVDKSKTRINNLKSRLNQNIKAQARNRRDIDMIYLVGTPEQTRLVKPYTEVNISPFAEIIPVYASSRSHSTKSDYSSNSDLKGLTFTEMPWLLSGEQNSELAHLSGELWPKRSDSLSRLFAMGFDSYQLIAKIPLMKKSPYIQHWGQTGVLKLNDNNVLTRSFLWGAYKNNKVVSIAME